MKRLLLALTAACAVSLVAVLGNSGHDAPRTAGDGRYGLVAVVLRGAVSEAVLASLQATVVDRGAGSGETTVEIPAENLSRAFSLPGVETRIARKVRSLAD